MTAQRERSWNAPPGPPEEQYRAGALHQDDRGEQDEIRQVPEVQETEKHLSSSYRQALASL